MRHLTFTDGVHFLAAVGLATVAVTGLGVTALVVARFVEEMQRARAVKALGGAL